MTPLDPIIAVAHPRRARILLILKDAEGPMTPSQVVILLEREIGESIFLSGVSYHFRQLAQVGLVSLVEEVPVRGAVAHYYEADESFDGILVEVAKRVVDEERT